MPTLKIDGKEVTVESGTTIIQAAKQLGTFIPHYCWHPGLSVAGNCRMCLVMVEKMPKAQISCHIACQDGMVVDTQSDRVKKLREHVLEFLLVNHPLDCPVCDQAGECWLQDYYMKYGLYDSRLNENKVKKTKKAFPIGPNVMLDSERCILCSRCVRFTDEISKTQEFGIFNRGDHAEIGVYPGRELDNNYSGNVVDICPVGALTDRDFRFKCRVWYLKKTESICPGCARGCNITIEANTERSHKAGGDRIMRLKPRCNNQVNDWWMCDSGRYGYQFIDHDRITEPIERVAGEERKTEMDQALRHAHVAFLDVLNQSKKRVAVLVSPEMTNEELYLAKRLFVEELGIERVCLFRTHPDGNQDDLLIRADKHPNRKGAEWIGFKEGEQTARGFIEDLKKGAFEGAIFFGQDILSLFPEEDLKERIEALRFTLFIGSNHNTTSRACRYVLPAATYAEKDGTFTNFEGRVQRIRPAVPPLGSSQSELKILFVLAKKFGLDWSHTSPENVFDGLSKSIAQFQGMSYGAIGDQGVSAS
jgi:NADH-quinone oxidoreductase subunit G